MDVPLMVLLSTVLFQFIDLLRELANWSTAKSSVVTQMCAFAGGVVVVVLAAHSGLFDNLAVNGHPLTSLDGGSQVFLGLGIASLGSTISDVKSAIDRSDSAAKPPLLGP